jgi:hypothetical protein
MRLKVRRKKVVENTSLRTFFVRLALPDRVTYPSKNASRGQDRQSRGSAGPTVAIKAGTVAANQG